MHLKGSEVASNFYRDAGCMCLLYKPHSTIPAGLCQCDCSVGSSVVTNIITVVSIKPKEIPCS
jgi:hypothetical protein